MVYLLYQKYRCWLPGAGLLLLVLLLLGVLSLVDTRASLAREVSGDPALTLLASPNFTVAPGSVISYTLRVKNHGDGTVDYVRLKLPYDRTQLTLLDARFEAPTDYVEAVGDHIQVFFDAVQKDVTRSATVTMRVAENLPNDTVITMAASYIWEDRYGNYDLHNRSNALPLIVSGENRSLPYVWTVATPAEGAVGTRFEFFSDRFVPGERVTPWLQATGAPERRFNSERQTVDGNGQVRIRVTSTNLAPGSYQMFLRGERSDLQGVVSFTVTPAASPAVGE